MKVLLSWLKDFVDINVDIETLSKKLVNIGFEIEETIDLSQNMKNVVVGKIERITKHPDADKLQVCEINIGNKQNLQIVTGATNVFEGALVPVALDGSILPTGQKIKKGKLRGVESFGMLCSGEELMISEADYEGASVHGILILDKDEKIGTDLNNVLGNNDIILDVSVTSNRPDCNSMLGIAREIAAVLNQKLRMPNFEYKVTSKKNINNILNLKTDKKLCPQYIASAVENIKIQKSPKLISTRLRKLGFKSINNIVDITNYILLEIGQPMHAFDYQNIIGQEINVRKAKEHEKIKLLNDKECELNKNILVIANKEKPMAIAGVMGGMDSGINNETKTIIFESAKFLKENIRRTSIAIGVKSDSSFRYERGIDLYSQELGYKRALSLISQYNMGDIIEGVLVEKQEIKKKEALVVPIKKINEILGIDVDIVVAAKILNNLQIETTIENKTNLVIIPPEFRDDIISANDVAEEVIRFYGYEHIVPTLIKEAQHTLGGRTDSQKRVYQTKQELVENGYSEILTYSFISPKMFDTLLLKDDSPLRGAIEISNPLGYDVSIMRTTLIPSMINILSSNYKKGVKDTRFFEISKVYISKTGKTLEELPNEIYNLCVGSYGSEEDFYQIKSIILKVITKYNKKIEIVRSNKEYLHPGISIDIYVEAKYVGSLGEIHPLVMKNLSIQDKFYIAEINLDLLEELYKNNFKFEEISKFPAVTRDIAIVVKEEVTAADILSTIKQSAGSKLVNAKIFDIYRSEKLGKGMKSIAISLEFRSKDSTFTDEEIQEKVNKVLNNLNDKLGAELR